MSIDNDAGWAFRQRRLMTTIEVEKYPDTDVTQVRMHRAGCTHYITDMKPGERITMEITGDGDLIVQSRLYKL